LWKLLKPYKYLISKQNDFDKEFNYGNIKKYGDFFNDNWGSLYNEIRELNSLQQVYSLWKDEEKFNCYITIRPDLMYHDPIDIKAIEKIILNPTKNILHP
jgi:hypothetical protein